MQGGWGVAVLFPHDVEEFGDAAGLAGRGANGIEGGAGALGHAGSHPRGLVPDVGDTRRVGTSAAGIRSGRPVPLAGAVEGYAVL